MAKYFRIVINDYEEEVQIPITKGEAQSNPYDVLVQA